MNANWSPEDDKDMDAYAKQLANKDNAFKSGKKTHKPDMDAVQVDDTQSVDQ